MFKIDRTVIHSAMSYPEYRKLIENLLEHNKTTGHNQSSAMLHYTTMNVVRMERLDKTIRLSPEVQAGISLIQHPQLWLVLTEAWCGDAAQSIPVMAKMAQLNPKIDLRLILRDENPEIMNAFLTNGSRSVPKLIVLNTDTLEVHGSWGPRPAEAQKLAMDDKKAGEALPDEKARKEQSKDIAAELQKWYAKDKTRSIQDELLDVVIMKNPQIAA